MPGFETLRALLRYGDPSSSGLPKEGTPVFGLSLEHAAPQVGERTPGALQVLEKARALRVG